jgi:hypothetical protein
MAVATTIAATITTVDDVPAATITSTTTIDEASLPKQTYIK